MLRPFLGLYLAVADKGEMYVCVNKTSQKKSSQPLDYAISAWQAEQMLMPICIKLYFLGWFPVVIH